MKKARSGARESATDDGGIVEAIRKSTIGKVKVAVSDIDGILRGKYIHRDKFFSAVEGGFGFCDVVFGWDMHDQCYDNTKLTGWHHGFPDAMVRLDLNTYRTVPWDNNVPFFLGNFVTADGEPAPRLPAPGAEARARARREDGLRRRWSARSTSSSTSPRRRSRGPTKKGAAPTTITPGHVRLLAAAREPEPRVLQRADGRDGRLRHSHRGPAHRDRPRRLRGGDPVLRGARGRRPRAALQDRGEGDRRIASGSCRRFMAKWSAQYPGCSGPPAPEPHRRQEEPLLRREGQATAACRSSSRATSRASARC